MKVSLISYTQEAVELLIFTKNTRLKMSPAALDEIKKWDGDRKYYELEYMANTIPSSWEFVDYVFLIEGVTRAFTHQLVRTRNASFAQQTMRVLDVSEGNGWEYLTGPSIKEHSDREDVYDIEMMMIDKTYKHLLKKGARIEDARGILPTNILTNIVMKINMRNFVELIQKRSSPRVQGEYRNVLQAMKEQVLIAHPWMRIFIDRTFDRAAADLDKAINEFDPASMFKMMAHDAVVDKKKLEDFKTGLIKLVDQLRSKQ